MFIKKKLKYFTRLKQISPDLSGDFRIVWMYMIILYMDSIKCIPVQYIYETVYYPYFVESSFVIYQQ